MTWEHITHIKARILELWAANASTPVRISCIKFAQRVVLAQTAMNPNEPRVRRAVDCPRETGVLTYS